MAEQPLQPTALSTVSSNIRSHFTILRTYWWFTALVLVVALGATFLLTQRQNEVYSASSRVLLRTNSTVSLFPFSTSAPNSLLRRAETEQVYVQSTAFVQVARAQTPARVSVGGRADDNEVVFTARGSVPEDVAEAANVWAEAYVTERQAAFETEIQEGIDFLEMTIAELNAERDAIRAEVADLEALLEETTDPDQYSRLLSQKVSIEALLQPQLSPIDRQIADFGRELADLELVTRFLGEPESSARVVRTARVPSSPVSPNVTRNLAVGALLGLALGIGLPYLRHALNERIEDADDVAATTRLPVLGSVPTFEHGEEAAIEVMDRPGSLAAERYQAILTAIEFASIGEPISSVVFTSSAPGDGKTTTAVNIASLAACYMNVILVDGDMRRPNVHEYVNAPNTAGLSDVLAGQAELSNARQTFERDDTRFDVLAAGTMIDDPALLLRGDVWPNLLADLFLYDLVVIDAPPVLAVTDALLLGRVADGQILLCKSGETVRRDLAAAVDLLATNGTRCLGAVLNQESTATGRYAYYGGYSAKP